MSLTTRFHESNPTNISQWTFVNPNDFNAKYKIYEKTMSRVESYKIILGIVVKSIFTLGIYYLIYLNCTKDGKADLANLKRRKFVHYVPNNMSDPAGNVDKYARNSHLVSPKDMNRHSELLERNEQRAGMENFDTDPRLSDNFKSCIKQVKDFRDLTDDINKVILTKRVYFLEQLYGKNVKLSAEQSSADLFDEVEKFLKLSEEQQNSYNLIRLLSPFFNKVDVSEILRDAIKEAKKSQYEKKTMYHRAFEEFQEAFNNLDSKTDWLISIREKADLLEFMHQLYEIGDHYSPKFIHLYDDLNGCYKECLTSMKEPIQVDQVIKDKLVENFQTWKQLAGQLQKNLTPEGEACGVYYTFSDYLHADLLMLGFNEEFQTAIVSNDINLNFIILYFSGQSNKILSNLQSLLKNSKLEEAAKKECQKKIEKAKKDDAEALKKVEDPSTKDAFNKMKRCFIDNTNYNDAVHLLVEVEFLFKVYHSENYKPIFFDFLKELKQSEFFIKGKDAVCDKYFYLNFNAYFSRIDLLITVLDDIVIKTAL